MYREPGRDGGLAGRAPEAQTATGYKLTSADDIPTRDPQEWTLEGSRDGTRWQTLDRQNLGKPFEQRHQTKAFAIAQPGAYRFYRLSFAAKNPSHFQVAEIALDGVALSGESSVPADYRRELDIATGVHRTTFHAERHRLHPRGVCQPPGAGADTPLHRRQARRTLRARSNFARASPTRRSAPVPAGFSGTR